MAQLVKNLPTNAGDINMGVTAVYKHSFSEIKSRGEESLRSLKFYFAVTEK